MNRHNANVRILIVEDEPDVAEGIDVALRRAGYKTEIATDGQEGYEMAMMNSYGAILLDVMLPHMDGKTVCRSLRDAGISTPVIMVTARDALEDRVGGLDIGADDYIVKPFAIDELLARIRAVTRREAANRSSMINVGPLEIDTGAQSAKVGGKTVQLTQREFTLLEALARNAGRVLTRDAILSRVWNTDEALPNTVNFHMKSLRRKVDPDGRLIHTVHGFGYVMRWEGD